MDQPTPILRRDYVSAPSHCLRLSLRALNTTFVHEKIAANVRKANVYRAEATCLRPLCMTEAEIALRLTKTGIKILSDSFLL